MMKTPALALLFTIGAVLSVLFLAILGGQAHGGLLSVHVPSPSFGGWATTIPLAHPMRASPSVLVSAGPLASPSGSPGSPSTIPVGIFPVAVAYDPVNEELYVSDFGSPNGSNNITVVNTTLNRVVATIEVPFGVGPLAVSARGYVYFGDYDMTVYAISPYTNQVIAAIPLGAGCPNGCGPQPVAYDSRNRDIYVVDISSDNVSVIHNTSLVASIPVGLYPNGGVYDPSNGNVYIENEGGSVSIINGSTNSVMGSIPVLDPGPGLAYDPSNGDIYECENHASYGNVVTVISGATDRVIDTIPVGPSCNSETFDSANGFIYVPDNFQLLPGQSENGTLDYQRNVTVIDTRSNAVVSLLPVQQAPYGITYDPANQLVYVADAFTNNLSVLPPIYNLTFQAGSWLPSPVTWSLTMANLTLWSNASNIRFAEPNGTYAYSLHVMGYPSLNTTGLVTVNGSAVSILLTQSGGVTYPVTFSEVGLPRGPSWSVTLASSSQSPTTGSITFTEPNGTFSYTVGSVAGYAASPSSASVTVNGGPISQVITFTAIPPPTYAVTFLETGLPSGSTWYVNSTDSNWISQSTTVVVQNGTTMLVNLVNGTYAYRVQTSNKLYSTAENESFSVAGAAIGVPVGFNPYTYSVTFSVSGLPSGSQWYVNFTGGASLNSTTSTITFEEPNGTYPFTVATGADYVPASSIGSVVVAGNPTSELIAFTIAYVVTFDRPSGAQTGASWTVYVNSTTASYLSGSAQVSSGSIVQSTTASTLTILLPNGTYAYWIVVSGQPSLTTQGSVTVQGSPLVANPPSNPPTFIGFTGLTGYYILVAVAVAAVVVIVVVVVMRRQPPEAPPPPAT